MQPLLDTLKARHDGLIYGVVEMLPKLLKASVHVNLPLLPHSMESLVHLLPKALTKLSEGVALGILHVLEK